MSDVGNVIQVVTAIGTKTDAQAIVNEVVGKRLAACTQIIGPVTSTYWWQGEMQTEEEWLCVIKSRRDLYGALEATIRTAHPYEVPEILAVPVVAGSANYLTWLNQELNNPQ